MDQKTSVIFVVVIVVIAVLAMLLAYKRDKETCSARTANKRNISGPKTWLALEPTAGADEPQMEHQETDALRSPLYPMRQILDQLTLIADHCVRRRRCYECLAKHMMTIEAWADFGSSLAGGATDDYDKIAQSASEKLTETRRLGAVKSRLADWANELYRKIRDAYPSLDLDFNRLQEYEIQETKTPLLPLRLPHFNLREIAKLLLLMEVTTAHPNTRCSECLRYLLTKTAAFAKEGSEMSPELRSEFEAIRSSADGKLAGIAGLGISGETSQWFRAERKRINEAYPELHEQGLYKDYETPVYLAKCGDTCS